MKILVTGATGMFWSRISQRLAEQGAEVLALTRNPEKAKQITSGNITGVVGDLDDPATIKDSFEASDRMFMVSPMHPDLGRRESGAIQMAVESELDQIVKIFGSVRHEGDALDRAHQIAIDSLKKSGVPWTMVSPQTVMETNLLGQVEGIKQERSMFGCAGNGKIGMVALEDCVAVATRVLLSNPAEFAGRNLEITGPEALSYAEIAAEMSAALECTIKYVDMPEAEFREMLIAYGMNPEDLELQILCHFRQMREGNASLVTDTFEEVTEKKATSVREWAKEHREQLGLA